MSLCLFEGEKKAARMGAFDAISALRISLASREQIRQWSHGEVTKSETLHYRTHTPVGDGLFCQRIFGPVRNWSCACGKYQHVRRAGFICEQCGVELAPASVRRERMGHIELAVPLVHPWFVRDHTISLLLDLSPSQLSALVTAQRSIVLWVHEEGRAQALARHDAEDEDERTLHAHFARLHRGDLLEPYHSQALSRRFPHLFQAKTGAEALRDLLERLDLDRLAEQLRREIAEGNTPRKATRRLQLVEALRSSGQYPGWMILTCIPVLPPELRPMLVLDGGRIASSDLNELYRRLISRNLRLKRFLEVRAPEIILNNERRLLQEACDALFDNAHARKPVVNARGKPLKSLTDLLHGKHGRFRHHLLGKRVDYSGRSVIVVGPTLRLHECGLPKDMACELFKPFLIRTLLDRAFAAHPREAKRMVERRDALIWDLLAEVLFERLVLLNRAPTLHRLGIQAFQPRLIEGNAIQLHPLVCSAFNADFDGDQMAVHVPLSEVAQAEARRLLLSTRHLRHPASGGPTMSPSQEMVLGCFYLTETRADTPSKRWVFSEPNEALLAYVTGHLALHTRITVRLSDSAIYNAPPPDLPATPGRGRIDTTVGRLLFNDILPQPLRYRNYPMTKDRLKELVTTCLTLCGEAETVQLLERMKQLGFRYATQSGLSLALSDIVLPPARETLIAQGRTQIAEVEQSYQRGELTAEERDRQVIDIWTRITALISDTLTAVLPADGPIMTIIQSGATKAKFQQIRQLSGIRGLMASPSGKIIPVPVLSNYKSGLQGWEIFIAASGARKGFMDRSLNTAMSGYLTRRLVEAGMEVIVTQEDCQTTDGLLITEEESRRIGLPRMCSRIMGRVLAEPVADLQAGTLLDQPLTDALLARGVSSVRVRSPLTCEAAYGVCRRCYGTDLATGALVRMGTAVGIIAGQAIGEPGTQLTMRTFHSGGIAQNASDITLGLPRVNALFEVHTPARAAPIAEKAGRITQIETDPHTGGYRIHFLAQTHEGHEAWTCSIPFRGTLIVQAGQTVEVGMPLVEGPLHPQDLLERLGREAVARYLLREVQRVYRGTGAVIHDKHIEVIIRQMLRFVRMTDAGDTTLIPGVVMDRFAFLHQVASLLAQGGRPPRARPVLLGLTQTALQTASWLARHPSRTRAACSPVQPCRRSSIRWSASKND